jgi:polyisoprenoid-binding protein YceI
MRNLAIVLVGVALAAGSEARAQGVAVKGGKATFDASNAKIEFVGTKPGGKHDGGFKSFTGTAELTPDGKGLSKVTLEIDATSLWSDTPKLTGHLKSPDFFDIKRFPKVSFTSTKIAVGGKGGATHTVTGNLTLHGETKEISVPATVRVANNGLVVQGSFNLDRTQFGMVYGKGKVHDDVKVTVAIGK